MIGISDKEYQLNKALGTAKKSYAYKTDGKVYSAKPTGEDYGPKFEVKDIIGCGIILSKKQIFFTQNGRFLGIAFNSVELEKDSMYPSVCLQSINEEIQSNFNGT